METYRNNQNSIVYLFCFNFSWFIKMYSVRKGLARPLNEMLVPKCFWIFVDNIKSYYQFKMENTAIEMRILIYILTLQSSFKGKPFFPFFFEPLPQGELAVVDDYGLWKRWRVWSFVSSLNGAGKGERDRGFQGIFLTRRLISWLCSFRPGWWVMFTLFLLVGSFGKLHI